MKKLILALGVSMILGAVSCTKTAIQPEKVDYNGTHKIKYGTVVFWHKIQTQAGVAVITINDVTQTSAQYAENAPSCDPNQPYATFSLEVGVPYKYTGSSLKGPKNYVWAGTVTINSEGECQNIELK